MDLSIGNTATIIPRALREAGIPDLKYNAPPPGHRTVAKWRAFINSLRADLQTIQEQERDLLRELIDANGKIAELIEDCHHQRMSAMLGMEGDTRLVLKRMLADMLACGPSCSIGRVKALADLLFPGESVSETK